MDRKNQARFSAGNPVTRFGTNPAFSFEERPKYRSLGAAGPAAPQQHAQRLAATAFAQRSEDTNRAAFTRSQPWMFGEGANLNKFGDGSFGTAPVGVADATRAAKVMAPSTAASSHFGSVLPGFAQQPYVGVADKDERVLNMAVLAPFAQDSMDMTGLPLRLQRGPEPLAKGLDATGLELPSLKLKLKLPALIMTPTPAVLEPPPPASPGMAMLQEGADCPPGMGGTPCAPTALRVRTRCTVAQVGRFLKAFLTQRADVCTTKTLGAIIQMDGRVYVKARPVSFHVSLYANVEGPRDTQRNGWSGVDIERRNGTVFLFHEFVREVEGEIERRGREVLGGEPEATISRALPPPMPALPSMSDEEATDCTVENMSHLLDCLPAHFEVDVELLAQLATLSKSNEHVKVLRSLSGRLVPLLKQYLSSRGSEQAGSPQSPRINVDLARSALIVLENLTSLRASGSGSDTELREKQRAVELGLVPVLCQLRWHDSPKLAARGIRVLRGILHKDLAADLQEEDRSCLARLETAVARESSDFSQRYSSTAPENLKTSVSHPQFEARPGSSLPAFTLPMLDPQPQYQGQSVELPTSSQSTRAAFPRSAAVSTTSMSMMMNADSSLLPARLEDFSVPPMSMGMELPSSLTSPLSLIPPRRLQEQLQQPHDRAELTSELASLTARLNEVFSSVGMQ